MTVLVTEMLRDGEWKAVGTPPDVQLAVIDSNIVVTVTVGHIAPPWRVLHDGAVLFERTQ